jgi:hypothetical protein
MRKSDFGNLQKKLKNMSFKIKLQYPCYIYDANHNLKNIITEKIVNTRDARFDNFEIFADKNRIITEGKVNT